MASEEKSLINYSFEPLPASQSGSLCGKKNIFVYSKSEDLKEDKA
jgi:hypothetical protein